MSFVILTVSRRLLSATPFAAGAIAAGMVIMNAPTAGADITAVAEGCARAGGEYSVVVLEGHIYESCCFKSKPGKPMYCNWYQDGEFTVSGWGPVSALPPPNEGPPRPSGPVNPGPPVANPGPPDEGNPAPPPVVIP